LSSNAPGFQHLFAEAPSPIVTAVGRFDYQYLLGRLDESEFFDFDRANDARSLSAAQLSWQAEADGERWPVVGIARAVMANGPPRLATMLDFARDVGRPWSRPADAASGRDQILTLFARWLFPAEGAE